MSRFVINANFKAVMKGEYAEASVESGEFILDSDDIESVTGAIITGIAEENKIEVHGKTKADKLASLIAGLEGLKIGEIREPTVMMKVKALVEAHVVDGKLNATEDDLVVEILTQQICGFKHAGKNLKLALEQLGLQTSNKDKLASAESILAKSDFAPQNWGDVLDMAERIAAETPNTNEKQAVGLIKKFAKKNGIELPAKPKKEKGEKVKGVSGFKAKLIKYLTDNPTATKDDVETFCVDSDKKKELADRFEWVRILANNLAK